MSLVEDPNPRAYIGANHPPIAVVLADRHADLLAEAGPLGDRAASLPKRIDNDFALGRLGDVVKDTGKLIKRIDQVRLDETEPHRTAQDEINRFFNGFKETLEAVSDRLGALATDYNRAKAAEERRAAEERARQYREEADRQRRIAEEAKAKEQAGKSLRHDDRAEEAEESARRAEARARAKSADLTRVRSGTGTVATTRSIWKGEILDTSKIDLEKLRPYLSAEILQKAINNYVKMGGRDLAGVRIFQDDKASFR